ATSAESLPLAIRARADRVGPRAVREAGAASHDDASHGRSYLASSVATSSASPRCQGGGTIPRPRIRVVSRTEYAGRFGGVGYGAVGLGPLRSHAIGVRARAASTIAEANACHVVAPSFAK